MNFNGINPQKINGVIKEVANKKEVIEKTVAETVKEAENKAVPNMGRDLVKTAGKDSSKIAISDLIKDGYTFGTNNTIYKMDHKKDIYKAFQFKDGKVNNITIQDTVPGSKRAVVTQKMEDGKWVSLTDSGKGYTFIKGNPSETSLKKATELQFDGYRITAQDEKTLTLTKGDDSVVISK